MRKVHMEVWRGREKQAELAQDGFVHPRWTQLNDWPDAVFEKQRAALFERDTTTTPVPDLVNVFAIARRIEDLELVNRLAPALLDRSSQAKPEDAWVFHDLGFHFQNPKVRQYDQVRRAFEIALKLGTADAALTPKTQVHLAGFLLHGANDPAFALRLLEGVKPDNLVDLDKRLARIYEADALLAQGHADKARDIYRSIGSVQPAADVTYAVRRRARLEAAKSYLKDGEFDAAERVIREVEWETPIERMNTETGLVMIQTQIGRQEYLFAFAHCQRLLMASPDGRSRAEILVNLIKTALALDRKPDAAKAYATLLKDHPYEEATAVAKDKWSGLFGAAR